VHHLCGFNLRVCFGGVIKPWGKMTKRILCVDDDEDSVAALGILLLSERFEVVTALTAAEGLQLSREGHFDLYLLDNLLPDGTGLDLCRQIRNFDPRTPILYHSGMDEPEDREQALSAGAQGYLVKPADFDELVRTIRELIATAEGRAEIEGAG